MTRRMAGYVRCGEVFVAPDSRLEVLVESSTSEPYDMVALRGPDENGEIRTVVLPRDELVELPLRSKVRP